MATNFTISSDSESELSEEIEEGENSQLQTEQEQQVFQRHTLTLPELRMAGRTLQVKGEDEAGTPTDGAPFRGRSKSAPPSLWAAKKYGQRLRRMSDEFDRQEWKTRSAGTATQMHQSRSWWSYLFSHQETDGENNHHDSHTHRNE
uniref:Uncharacterized protein n=1 Tax=Mola mola TaxID=94237 RepID=A0A3Q3WTY4_MOLML